MAAKKKNSLVANINRRKRAGTSRPKSKSTISAKAYSEMEHGWPDAAKKNNNKKKKKTTAKKRAPAKRAK